MESFDNSPSHHLIVTKLMTSGSTVQSAGHINVRYRVYYQGIVVEGMHDMTITLPLEPQKEAKLNALAQEKGVTADELVREAINKIIAEAPESTGRKVPTLSLRGLLSEYGTAPSAEEIDQNRAEMFANFPRSNF
jgi:hypothetical protein